MRIPIYWVDAFTDHPFTGNPAAVCILDDFLDDDLLQAIATENNLSETAFLVADDDFWHIRWFTPSAEVSLCGHATLASGAVGQTQGVVPGQIHLSDLQQQRRQPSQVCVDR